MKNLQLHNSQFITYKGEIFTVDVLGDMGTQQIERMICTTLRITSQNYPPLRSTLDLYNDNQADTLIRTLCDKWDGISKSVHLMIVQLESYKLDRLKYPAKTASV